MSYTHDKHEHKHHHEGCGCGHHHENEHHHHEECGCGHHHEHHEHREKTRDVFKDGTKSEHQKVYIIENLGCANCAAKMEKKINDLPQVEAASITFATKQLKVVAESQEGLLPILQEICMSIEPDVILREKGKKKKDTNDQSKKTIRTIAVGAVIFIVGALLKSLWFPAAFVSFLIAYLVLGSSILSKAGKNLLKGQIFDENFLMSLATIAAFGIGEYAEAVGVLLFFRIGEWFEDLAVEKSRNQIMDAVDMRPEIVNLVRGNEVIVIPAENAKVGDILLVRVGDRIPLDGVIVHGESRIDTAPVTGESVPVKAKVGDSILSGCVNTSSTIRIRVEKCLEDSMVTRILQSVENAAASKPKIDRFITRFARVYTPFVVLLALLTAVIPSLITGDWKFWVYTAITFLVISCPCALVLSVPLAFFSGIGAGSKKGILFKGGYAIEALKQVKAVVMDKTGTITKGTFEVLESVPSGAIAEDKYASEKLLMLAASCEMDSTHPIAESIVAASKKYFLELKRPETIEEISGKGIHAVIDGKEALCGNKALMELFQIDLNEYQGEQEGTEVLVAYEGTYYGYLVIADAVKEEARTAISHLKEKRLKTAMLTGDTKQCADRVASLTGVEEVYAQLLPEEKLEKLENLREQYGEVMFVGDGINDAPVLAGANVGAAMGSGADAAIEAADVVFMTSSVQAIPEAISIAARTSHIAVENVVFALVIKGLVMVLGLLGYANMWMAVFADSGVAMLCVLNSIRILYMKNTLTDKRRK